MSAEEQNQQAEEVEANPNQVFMGNLSPETSVDDLTGHLNALNLAPTGVTLFEDADGRSKGCAMAVFASEDAANAAIEAANATTLKENEIFARADKGPRRRARNRPVNEDQSFLYVGNLDLKAKAEDLQAHLEQFGTVTYCQLSRNKRREGVSLGWASAQFESVEQAQAAMAAANGSDFQGRPLTVEPLRSAPRRRRKKAPAAPVEGEEPEAINAAILYVGNLSWETEEEALTQLFAPFGTVVNAEIARDKRDKRESKSRGWGTVEFSSEQEAAAAMEALNKTEVSGREIDVQVRRGPRRRAPRENAEGKRSGRRRARRRNGGGDEGDGGEEEEKLGGRRRPRRQRQRNASQQDGEEGEEGGEERTGRRRPRRRNRNAGGEGDEAAPRARRERKEPEPTVVDNPECYLYVGNLLWEVTSEDLVELFSQYGTVTNAVITMDERQGKSRGWGTVEMGSQAEANSAAEALNGTEYRERTLAVRPDKRVVGPSS